MEQTKEHEVRKALRLITREISHLNRKFEQVDEEYLQEIKELIESRDQTIEDMIEEVGQRREAELLAVQAKLNELDAKARGHFDVLVHSFDQTGYDGPHAKITTRKSTRIEVSDDWTNEGAIEPFTVTKSTISKDAIKRALAAGDLKVVNTDIENGNQIVDEMGQILEGVRQAEHVNISFKMKDTQ